MPQRNNQNLVPRTEADVAGLHPVPDLFSLGEPPAIEHKRDARTGREFMILDSTVPYPRDLNEDDPLQKVLLPQVSSQPDVFQLPREYMPVQQVLNEASGAGVGVEGSTALRNAGTGAFRNTFAKIGEVVGNLISKQQITPTTVDYRRVILEQQPTGATVRFLPPLEFNSLVPGSDRTAVIEKLRATLSSGLYEGSTDTVQRTLTTQGIAAFDQSIVEAMKRIK